MRRFYLTNCVNSPIIVVFATQRGAKTYKCNRLRGVFGQGPGCTGCKYCMPCPKNVNIPEIFAIMNYHRVYQITEFAKKSCAEIGKVPWRNYENAAACVNRGACEKKCPQSLPIREQLKETHRVLAS